MQQTMCPYFTMHQLAVMQNRQNRQDLAQQRQHLASTEASWTQQDVSGDAFLPVAHEPEDPIELEQHAAAGQLRMQQ